MSTHDSLPGALTAITSMATRTLLAELAAGWQQHGGMPLALQSVGGVDAARRVAAGEAFDVVVLAADAIDRLIAAGHLLPGRVDLARSPVAIAVRAGAARPAITSEAAVRLAVLGAGRIAYSTGPSGQFLITLFERWGIADDIRVRTVQAPAGTPVATLLARGEAELGFQQLSELQQAAGVDVLGVLPADIAFTTTFAAAIGTASVHADTVRALLAFFNTPKAAAIKHRHGMQDIGKGKGKDKDKDKDST